MHFRRRAAFTLVELLVVIAIIGVLVSMLLPAMGAVRESSRRVQCGNNIRQIGFAVMAYLATHEAYPFAGGYEIQTGTWTSFILPGIDQQGVYDKFDFNKPMNDAVNSVPVKTAIPLLICPSDSTADKAILGQRCVCCGLNSPAAGHGAWYVGSMGPTKPDVCSYCTDSYCCQGNSYGSDGSGVGMFSRSAQMIKEAHVRDGKSNTLMIGETLPNHCFHNSAYSSNFSIAGTQIPLNTMEGKEGIDPSANDSTLHSTNLHYKVCGFKSTHRNGAYFIMGDGSAQFINDSIDYRLYNNLGTRSGKESAQLP